MAWRQKSCDHGSCGSGERTKRIGTEQTGGFAVEINRGRRMRPQDRSRRHRTDLSLETALDRQSFPHVRHDTNNFLRLQNLTHRHGDGAARDFRNICEPSLANLLATAGFIELDDEIWIRRLEIRRRIVEREMTILPDTDKSDINRRRLQGRTNAADNFTGITAAIKQVILCNPHLMN